MNENVRILREVSERFNCEYRERYSGRGMYGRNCVGVVCSNPLSLCMTLGKEGFDVDLIPRTDNMGLSTIVYFPDLQDDSEDGNEGSEDDTDICPSCEISREKCGCGE
jgi:hypothetical protein